MKWKTVGNPVAQNTLPRPRRRRRYSSLARDVRDPRRRVANRPRRALRDFELVAAGRPRARSDVRHAGAGHRAAPLPSTHSRASAPASSDPAAPIVAADPSARRSASLAACPPRRSHVRTGRLRADRPARAGTGRSTSCSSSTRSSRPTSPPSRTESQARAVAPQRRLRPVRAHAPRGGQPASRRSATCAKRVALRRLELSYAPRFDEVIAVSERERAALLDAIPGLPVTVIENGVDTARLRPLPPAASGDRILFVGNLAYRPNVQAVVDLCTKILPLVRARLPTRASRSSGPIRPEPCSGSPGRERSR